jgi:hypothetical protein
MTMAKKPSIGPGMMKGIGAVKGSSEKPKLPRRKKPGIMSTSQYKQPKYK